MLSKPTIRLRFREQQEKSVCVSFKCGFVVDSGFYPEMRVKQTFLYLARMIQNTVEYMKSHACLYSKRDMTINEACQD